MAKKDLQFTPLALKRWESLSPDFRFLVLNNVWCCQCRGETSIAEFQGHIEKGDLILRGICTKCNGPVARLIEKC
jgi:hypothetical protein